MPRKLNKKIALFFLAYACCPGVADSKFDHDISPLTEKQADSRAVAQRSKEPYRCHPTKPVKAEKFIPKEPIEFALVKRNSEGKSVLTQPEEAGAECVPVVFKIDGKGGFEPIGPLCAEERAHRKSNSFVDAIMKTASAAAQQREYREEDEQRTFLPPDLCAMPKTHRFYTQLWLEEKQRYAKIAVPCMKQWDPAMEPKACFEEAKNEMHDLFREQFLEGIEKAMESFRKFDRNKFLASKIGEENVKKYQTAIDLGAEATSFMASRYGLPAIPIIVEKMLNEYKGLAQEEGT